MPSKEKSVSSPKCTVYSMKDYKKYYQIKYNITKGYLHYSLIYGTDCVHTVDILYLKTD